MLQAHNKYLQNEKCVHLPVCSATQSCPTLCDPRTVPTRLLYSWKFSGKNTGVCCHFFPQGIFLTQRSNRCLLHWQGDSLPRSHLGSPCPLAEMTANCLHLCPLPTPRTFLTDKSVVAIVLFSGCHALPTTPGPQWHLWVKPIAFQGCPRCHWPIYTKGLSKSDDWPSVKYHPLCSWNLRVSSVYTLSWSYLAPSSYCVKGPQVLLNKPC